MKKCSVALALALISSSALADDMEWIGQSYEEGASLLYGVPESGIVDITLSCEKGSDRLSFIYAYEPPNAKVGMKLDVHLTAGGKTLTIATTGDRLEMDDLFVLEGSTRLDSILISMILAKGEMIIKVGTDSDRYPLAGAKKAAADILKTCRR